MEVVDVEKGLISQEPVSGNPLEKEETTHAKRFLIDHERSTPLKNANSGHPVSNKRFVKYHVVYLSLLFLWAMLAAVFISLYIIERRKQAEDFGPCPRSVIFMIADGFGPASQTLARAVYTASQPEELQKEYFPQLIPLPLDELALATVRTRSFDRYVTDSAAGATAYACGKKTNNYVVAADENGKKLATLMEAAKAKGMTTSVIVTSTVSHATPASFTSHMAYREAEEDIVQWQMSGKPFNNSKPLVDFFVGGGLCKFLPYEQGSTCCRKDSFDGIKQAKLLNYSVIQDVDTFRGIDEKSKLPILALLAKGHLEYEVDRNPQTDPSLVEMVEKGLLMMEGSLMAPNSKGFFMFVEGSKIDMAAHENDAHTHAREVLGYNKAVSAIKKFVKENPSVLFISVADHETGGLSLGRKNDLDDRSYPVPYTFYPERLLPPKISLKKLASQLISFIESNSSSLSNVQIEEYVTKELRTKLHVTGMDCSLKKLVKKFIEQVPYPGEFPRWNIGDCEQMLNKTGQPAYPYTKSIHTETLARILGNIMAIYAQVSWSTPGHTGEDVILYAMGAKSEGLKRSMENTDVFSYMKEFLSLDMEPVNELLKSL